MIAAVLALFNLKAALAWAADNWKVLAIVALVAAIPIGYKIGHHKGDAAGYDRRIAEVAAADAKAAAERAHDDAKLKNLSDYDLCVEYLRGNGLHVDACEQLRGVQPQ